MVLMLDWQCDGCSWNAIKCVALIDPPPPIRSTFISKLSTQECVKTVWSGNMGLRARILFDLDASNAHWAYGVSISQTVL